MCEGKKTATGAKQGKFPHISEELQAPDTVWDLARIREGSMSLTDAGLMPGCLLHPSRLKLRSQNNQMAAGNDGSQLSPNYKPCISA